MLCQKVAERDDCVSEVCDKIFIAVLGQCFQQNKLVFCLRGPFKVGFYWYVAVKLFTSVRGQWQEAHLMPYVASW